MRNVYVTIQPPAYSDDTVADDYQTLITLAEIFINPHLVRIQCRSQEGTLLQEYSIDENEYRTYCDGSVLIRHAHLVIDSALASSRIGGTALFGIFFHMKKPIDPESERIGPWEVFSKVHFPDSTKFITISGEGLVLLRGSSGDEGSLFVRPSVTFIVIPRRNRST